MITAKNLQNAKKDFQSLKTNQEKDLNSEINQTWTLEVHPRKSKKNWEGKRQIDSLQQNLQESSQAGYGTQCDEKGSSQAASRALVMGLIGKCRHKQISLDPPRSRTKHNKI
jgi:hypothetical protein